MSNTLVIHPEDESTKMLKFVYEGKGFDVINDPSISKERLKEEINKHTKIIFLGHGTKEGLINPLAIKEFDFSKERLFLVDDSFKDILKNKETISMWCYSDEFFRRNNLKGFHTGMIISEALEAIMAINKYIDEKEIFENVTRLSKIFGECIDKDPIEMKNYILSNYTGDDPVTKFNRENIIVL